MNTRTNSGYLAGKDPVGQTVTFIQCDEPALKVEEYTIKVTQTTNTDAPNRFTATRNFAVTGARFSFQSGEIDSVFPPDLANGEFDGSLPCVVLNRRTLPWERYLDTGDAELPWLAVLLFDADKLPPIQAATASGLVTKGQAIKVLGNDQLTGKGKLPANLLSYPGINPLGYGETPDDTCSVIDIDLATFNLVAPSKKDMGYLAHIRQVDTVDTVTNGSEESIYSVVLGNRIAQTGQPAVACLVSLENMGAFLPADDGTPARFPDGVDTVRLILYRSWRFTANDLDQNFQKLLENLNGPPVDGKRLTTLQFPAGLTPPPDDQVKQALAAQAKGALDAPLAQVLVRNAFGQGYVPMNHEMRHADTSVSWYRGPCAALPVAEAAFVPAGSPDAATRYNPQTGLFDVSYSAAWQLGQLLALQNTSYANALFNWKKAVNGMAAAQAEQAILEAALGVGANDVPNGGFGALLSARRRALAPPPLPDEVAAWLADLRLLRGVPFSYLVPHEQMLPLESLHFFHLDLNWINYLVDGAFSIGRTCSRQLQSDARMFGQVKSASHPARLNRRRQRMGRLYQSNAGQQYTGFILRSQVVAGWPNLQVNGYTVPDDLGSEIRKLRMERLGPDCIVCIFDGEAKQVALHEPPEQLHCGIEANGKGFSTTLRAVTGATPGSQFPGTASAQIPMRGDKRTLKARQAADSILAALNGPPYNQGIQKFTSAEFALEMVKGVVKVNYNQQAQGNS